MDGIEARAMAALAERRQQASEGARQRAEEDAQRDAEHFAHLRRRAIEDLGIDHDWADAPLVVGAHLFTARLIYGRANLLPLWACGSCGELRDVDAEDLYPEIDTLATLGEYLERNPQPSPVTCATCRAKQAEAGRPWDDEMPAPPPTASERLVGALVDLLAEHGHSFGVPDEVYAQIECRSARASKRLDQMHRDVESAKREARDARSEAGDALTKAQRAVRGW